MERIQEYMKMHDDSHLPFTIASSYRQVLQCWISSLLLYNWQEKWYKKLEHKFARDGGRSLFLDHTHHHLYYHTTFRLLVSGNQLPETQHFVQCTNISSDTRDNNVHISSSSTGRSEKTRTFHVKKKNWWIYSGKRGSRLERWYSCINIHAGHMHRQDMFWYTVKYVITLLSIWLSCLLDTLGLEFLRVSQPTKEE